MKKTILFFVIGVRLIGATGVEAINYDTSYNQGILKIHTQGAPHLTKSGQIVNNWTTDSMFTRIVWNADAGAPDWFGGKSCPEKSYNGLDEIKAAGFNTVFGPYSSEAITMSKNAGLKVIKYVGGDAGPNIEQYKNMATNWKNRNEVIGYYLFDENPNLGGMSANIWKNVAQEMKKIDSSKFYFANWNRIGYKGECAEDVQTLREVDQLSSADVYPIKCNGGEAVDIYNTFKPWYNNCFDTNNVPLMPILQGFGSVRRENCIDGEGDWIIPSESDLRRQVYYSITGGATGFWYFLFQSSRHCIIDQFSRWDSCKSGEWCGLNQHANPSGWEAAKKINQEIQLYERELLSPTVWQGYEVWGEGEKLGVKSVFKAPTNQPGVIYLLIVASRNGAIKVSAPKVITKVESLLAPGKVISLQAGKNYFETNTGGRSGDRIDLFKITLMGAGPTATQVPTATKIPSPTATKIPTPTLTPKPTVTKTQIPTATKIPTLTLTPKPTVPKLVGDANGDAKVDINDASIWRSEFVSGELGIINKNIWRADFDKDQKVTLNDISIWRENFIKTL